VFLVIASCGTEPPAKSHQVDVPIDEKSTPTNIPQLRLPAPQAAPETHGEDEIDDASSIPARGTLSDLIDRWRQPARSDSRK